MDLWGSTAPSPLATISLFLFFFHSSTCHEGGHWECDQEPCLVDPDMIKAINRGNYG
jgi:hypothetical protein